MAGSSEPASRGLLKQFEQQEPDVYGQPVPVRRLAFLLRQMRGAVLRAWRLDFDPVGAGSVSSPEFMRVCRALNFSTEATDCFEALGAGSRSGSLLRFRELAPYEADNLEAFCDAVRSKTGSQGGECDLAKAWSYIAPSKATSYVSLGEFTSGAKKLGFTGDVRLLFKGFDRPGLGKLSRHEFETLDLAGLLHAAPYRRPPVEQSLSWSSSQETPRVTSVRDPLCIQTILSPVASPCASSIASPLPSSPIQSSQVSECQASEYQASEFSDSNSHCSKSTSRRSFGGFSSCSHTSRRNRPPQARNLSSAELQGRCITHRGNRVSSRASPFSSSSGRPSSVPNIRPQRSSLSHKSQKPVGSLRFASKSAQPSWMLNPFAAVGEVSQSERLASTLKKPASSASSTKASVSQFKEFAKQLKSRTTSSIRPLESVQSQQPQHKQPQQQPRQQSQQRPQQPQPHLPRRHQGERQNQQPEQQSPSSIGDVSACASTWSPPSTCNTYRVCGAGHVASLSAGVPEIQNTPGPDAGAGAGNSGPYECSTCPVRSDESRFSQRVDEEGNPRRAEICTKVAQAPVSAGIDGRCVEHITVMHPSSVGKRGEGGGDAAAGESSQPGCELFIDATNLKEAVSCEDGGANRGKTQTRKVAKAKHKDCDGQAAGAGKSTRRISKKTSSRPVHKKGFETGMTGHVLNGGAEDDQSDGMASTASESPKERIGDDTAIRRSQLVCGREERRTSKGLRACIAADEKEIFYMKQLSSDKAESDNDERDRSVSKSFLDNKPSNTFVATRPILIAADTAPDLALAGSALMRERQRRHSDPGGGGTAPFVAELLKMQSAILAKTVPLNLASSLDGTARGISAADGAKRIESHEEHISSERKPEETPRETDPKDSDEGMGEAKSSSQPAAKGGDVSDNAQTKTSSKTCIEEGDKQAEQLPESRQVKGKGKIGAPPLPPSSMRRSDDPCTKEGGNSPSSSEPATPGGKDGKGKGPPIIKGKGKGPGLPPNGKGSPGGKGKSPADEEPRKPDIRPNAPVKKLYWSPLRLTSEPQEETVWNAIEQEEIDVDTRELEELFADKICQPQAAPHTSKPPSAVDNAVAAVKKVKVLDNQRRQQICVMLARLPGIQLTCQAVRNVDHAALNRDQVELLCLNAPSQEEAFLMRSAQAEKTIDEFNVWDGAEEFLLSLLAIPHYKLRLEVWDFENSIQEQIEPIKHAQQVLARACESLLTSVGIQHLLGLILCVGNYLNGGTARGRADGFGIDALSQMRTLKMTTGDRPGATLVDYLVKQMETKFPGELVDMLSPGEEVDRVTHAARVNSKEVAETLRTLHVGAQRLLRQMRADQLKQDEALTRHAETVAMCVGEIEELRVQLQNAENQYDQLCNWFHMGHGNKSTDEFFGVWDLFMKDIRQALKVFTETETKKRRAAKPQRRATISNDISPKRAPASCIEDEAADSGNEEQADSSSSASSKRHGRIQRAKTVSFSADEADVFAKKISGDSLKGGIM